MSLAQSILVGLLAFAPELDAGPVSENTITKRDFNPTERRENEVSLVPSWSCRVDYDETGQPLPSWSCAAEEAPEAGTPALEWRCSEEAAADGSPSWKCGNAKETMWSCGAVEETIEARNIDNRGVGEVGPGFIFSKTARTALGNSDTDEDNILETEEELKRRDRNVTGISWCIIM